MQLLGGAL